MKDSPTEVKSEVWSYVPQAGFYDEVFNHNAEVRAHWDSLTDSLTRMGAAGLARRWQEGRRLIRENGVTYNVYGDAESTTRPWPVDPIPLTIGPEEWKGIEAAIQQRATLLNKILQDLYGEQRLLRERFLPPDLVFPNTSFLRPCRGIETPGKEFLHVYSADIARSPDGKWWVLSDRTQAPSGAGYALENRLVTTRVLQDAFREANVRRLAPFFQSYKETLQSLARTNRDNPRIVLLTPGPYNETYFEHAFLARYLGYTLVEGADLTVRDDHVFLKTLGGLLPVDVILRRQDDYFCDPVELRSDSMLGIPGLLQAVRTGNVAVANALGSGAVESPAYAPFLPGLCRHLLYEELKIPNVATWWCGQKAPLQYVTENLERLVIKPAFPSRNFNPLFGAKLSKPEREALIGKIASSPADYVAQEQVALSTVPVWDEGHMGPRHMVVRVFAVASNGSYAVMPGGLTRVSKALDSMVVSMQSGGGSKDTWVQGEGPAPMFTLLRQFSHPLEVSRATFDLPSRVADNLFWFGRYCERLDAALRVTRVLLPRFVHGGDASLEAGWRAALDVLSGMGYVGSGLDRAAAEHEVLDMIHNPKSPGGFVSCIRQIRRIATLLRDRISMDAWVIPNQMDQIFAVPAHTGRRLRAGAAQDQINRAIILLASLSGMATENMTRGDGWRFLDIGKRLERALQMTELLRYALAGEAREDVGVLEAVLEMADSSITYRSRYLTSLHASLVLDLLLVDEANPRSVAYQLMQLRDRIDQLPHAHTAIRRPQESREAMALLTTVQLADVRELAKSGGSTDALATLLEGLSASLTQLSETLSTAYFSHVVPSRLLAVP